MLSSLFTFVFCVIVIPWKCLRTFCMLIWNVYHNSTNKFIRMALEWALFLSLSQHNKQRSYQTCFLKQNCTLFPWAAWKTSWKKIYKLIIAHLIITVMCNVAMTVTNGFFVGLRAVGEGASVGITSPHVRGGSWAAAARRDGPARPFLRRGPPRWLQVRPRRAWRHGLLAHTEDWRHVLWETPRHGSGSQG